MNNAPDFLLSTLSKKNKTLYKTTENIIAGKRISTEDALLLYTEADVSMLGTLAHYIRQKKNGEKVFFIKNIHIEYTNICVNKCAFCSFRSRTSNDGWLMNPEDIFAVVEKNIPDGINEVHIVGGIHPEKDIHFWLPILQRIHTAFPHIHIKAFTAAELDYIISKAGMSISEGLALLKQNGLQSIPGGGAEIFNPDIRSRLYPTKINANRWLDIHREAHLCGLPSNATMLYGHVENLYDRIHHLDLLRTLQDETSGFNAFIPLKYKSKNNDLRGVKETSSLDDMKMFALSRIFLDNFPHIKAYWPMLGKEMALLATEFGADDLDGTIYNTTAIYTKAGALDQKPLMSPEDFIQQIKNHRKIPVERDALYKPVSMNK